MTSLTDPELIYLLACPHCGGDLSGAERLLRCTSCAREYEVRKGIPLLYPGNLDLDHLRQEENLAQVMKQPRLTRKDRFNSIQWNTSKQEFWEMVRDHIEPPTKAFINIGCGYDASFREFEQGGYLFVNFDIVYDMVYTLQRDFGARSCVAGDLNCLPFKKNSFDYVVSIDVIHHESDTLPALLKSFANLLRPGGSLFLEDLNAWAMFQSAKSLLLPRPLHRLLRSTYHGLKHSGHKPADYEFPTSVWRVKQLLGKLGFCNIKVHPNSAYPGVHPASFELYRFLSRMEWVRKYHNYHYMLTAIRRHA